MLRTPCILLTTIFQQQFCLTINGHFLQSFTSPILSVFKKKTCILYHLAFLVWFPAHYFITPISRFQPLKSHFLSTILPFLTMFLMVLKGFIYTIPVYFYAYLLAFSTKIHCIQHQNAQHLAPKHTSFYCKQPKKWCKWRFRGIYIHFASMYNAPLFAPKPTFARIDFLRQGERLVDGKGAHNVKKRSKNITKSELIRP